MKILAKKLSIYNYKPGDLLVRVFPGDYFDDGKPDNSWMKDKDECTPIEIVEFMENGDIKIKYKNSIIYRNKEYTNILSKESLDKGWGYGWQLYTKPEE